jgi:hypothetical protein
MYCSEKPPSQPTNICGTGFSLNVSYSFEFFVMLLEPFYRHTRTLFMDGDWNMVGYLSTVIVIGRRTSDQHLRSKSSLYPAKKFIFQISTVPLYQRNVREVGKTVNM